MSKAFKCDRCNKCFVPEESEGIMIRFMNPRCYEKKDFDGYATTSHPYFQTIGVDDFVDLCPYCSILFSRFLMNIPDISQKQQAP